MKKYLLSSLLLIFSCKAFAQNNTGIGTSTPNSKAILELSSANKGLLLPRVADTNAITGPIPAGLLVYSTSDNKLYCYQGVKWQIIAPGSGDFWDVLGNAGTVDGTHFIGTKNDVALNFRVNNELAGRISNAAGSTTAFGYQALGVNIPGIQSSAFGHYALANSLGSSNTGMGYFTLYSNTTGVSNTSMGTYAMLANSSGNNNTANGFYALYSNSNGHYNTAFGSEAGYAIVSGHSNTAIGIKAMHGNAYGSNNVAAGDSAMYNNSTGSNNSAFGSKALLNGTLGNFNTAIGSGTLTNVNGNNNSALGVNATLANGSLNNATAIGAFARADASNALVLGSVNGINGATADVMVGIGANTPLARLHVKHNSFPTPSLLIEETEDDFTRMEFRNTNANSFWQINASPQTVAANARMEIWSVNAGSPNTPLVIIGNGNAILQGILTQNSDARLKKNISPIQHGLDKITQLNGYTYNWKDPQRDTARQSGVLAQELQQVLPELVREDDKGKLSVNYSGIIPVMIEAMKEQQSMIKEQHAMIKNLQVEVELLKRK